MSPNIFVVYSTIKDEMHLIKDKAKYKKLNKSNIRDHYWLVAQYNPFFSLQELEIHRTWKNV